MNSYFIKDMQIANKNVKRCPSLLVIRKCKVKTTMRCYYTCSRMSKILKIKHNGC